MLYDFARAVILSAAAVILSPVGALAGAQDGGGFRQFLAAYRCAVVDRLERIYEAGDPSSHYDRFIAISVVGHPHGYVQCMFYDNRSKLLCEAASGYYFDAEDEPRTFWLSREALAVLRGLGFSTEDVQGNHALELDVATPPDFNAIADLILKALYGAYDARANSSLSFNAPFAPRESSSCIPVS